MSFAQLNLDPQIFKALSACGYTLPTPIQSRSIPEILEGKDVVASAQTGTGKTAAFVLPALHRLTLAKTKVIKPRVLILTPTRELASQITQAAGKYGKFLRFSIISLVGGMPYRQQLRDLSRPVDIIVATPGRLLDHMDNRRLDLSAIEMLILDEADRMLDMGFIDDVKAIAQATPANRQTLLFSATVDDRLGHIIRQLLKKPVQIDLSTEKLAPTLIKQEAYMVDNNQHKERVLRHLLANGNIYKAIIFSGTKINADYLAGRLRDEGFEAAPLHGDLKQNVRNRTIEQLRRGKIQFLIATDVAARGIDINDVTHVINYDLPKFSEDYVHRIGRTGRAGKTGIAISLVSPTDGKHLQKIERYTKQKLEFSIIPGLEPTKRINNNATGNSNSAGGGKKKFGKSFGGGGKSYFKTKDGHGKRDGGSEARSGFAARKGIRNDDSRGEYAGRKSYARNDADSRSEYTPRKNFRGNESSKTSFVKKDGDPRIQYAPRKAAKSNESRGRFTAKSENESKASFVKKDGDPRIQYAPRKASKSNESRGRFAAKKDGPAKSEYAGRRSRNSNDTRGNFAKNDGGRSFSKGSRNKAFKK